MKITYTNNQWTAAQKQARIHIARPGEASKTSATMENAFTKMLMGPKGKEVLQTIEQREESKKTQARAIRFRNDCERKAARIHR